MGSQTVWTSVVCLEISTSCHRHFCTD